MIGHIQYLGRKSLVNLFFGFRLKTSCFLILKEISIRKSQEENYYGVCYA